MSPVFRPVMPRPVALWLSGIVWIAAVSGPCDVPSATGREPGTLQRGMVVAVSAPAAEVGAEVLKQGGNAVDAAVATALALAVTYPPAGNIGGGGFMMILPRPGTRPVCIDYRETAPAAATRTMFADETDRYGPRVVGVPGTVRGLTLAQRTYGSLPWAEVVRPAIRLARE
jgi:gamma-glutamyltranspeptidase / glutathione hydrolase